MFSICFSREIKPIINIHVDKYGVFRLGDNSECMEIDLGDFDYDYIKEIYSE